MAQIIGEYRIIRKLGAGAFGMTYLAEHILLGKQACIKRLHPQFAKDPMYVEMLRAEASKLWDIHHDALPAIRGYMEDPKHGPLIIMSYIEGVNLQDDIVRNGPIDDEHIMWILARLLDALTYMHLRLQLVHCDIKPSNISLNIPLHEAWLLDFGLSVQNPDGSTKPLGGTPGYLPPEFECGLAPVPVSDFYSLGQVAIFLAGGDPNSGNIPDDMCQPLRELIATMTIQDSVVRREKLGDSGLIIAQDIARIRQKVYGRTESTEMFKRRNGKVER